MICINVINSSEEYSRNYSVIYMYKYYCMITWMTHEISLYDNLPSSLLKLVAPQNNEYSQNISILLVIWLNAEEITCSANQLGSISVALLSLVFIPPKKCGLLFRTGARNQALLYKPIQSELIIETYFKLLDILS